MFILSRKKWGFVTMVFITMFSLVIFLHAMIPHDHPHEIYGDGIFAALHSIAAEKLFVLPPLFLIFLVLRFVPPQPIVDRSFSRGVQAPRALLFIGLRVFFAKGILNTKAY